MQVELTSRVTIEASTKEVFKYLCDPTLHYLWNPHLQSISVKDLLQKGTEYQTTSLLMGVHFTATNLVTDLKANSNIVFNSSGGAVDSSARYVLEKSALGTVVVCSTDVTLTSKAFSFTQPVLRMLVKREIQTDLQALKIAVEQKLR